MQRLGQHFLTNTGVLRKIAGAITTPPGETVIEIGPGHGELTERLLERTGAGKVIAIERDAQLAAALRKKFLGVEPLEIVEGDALTLLPALIKERGLQSTSYAVVGNIPYYITGYLFRTIGELDSPPSCAVFLIQEEVAERAIAEPPRMNRLAASIHLWADPKLLFHVPREDFRPQPKVESAVILLAAHHKVDTQAKAGIDQLVGIIFRQPRKTILNNLRAGYELETEQLQEIVTRSGLRPTDRPQDVSFEELALLSEQLTRFREIA